MQANTLYHTLAKKGGALIPDTNQSDTLGTTVMHCSVTSMGRKVLINWVIQTARLRILSNAHLQLYQSPTLRQHHFNALGQLYHIITKSRFLFML